MTDKEKHIHLVATEFFNEIIDSDLLDNIKRPFGNSDIAGDILEIIDMKPEGEDHNFSEEQLDYANDIYYKDMFPYLLKLLKRKE